MNCGGPKMARYIVDLFIYIDGPLSSDLLFRRHGGRDIQDRFGLLGAESNLFRAQKQA